MVGNVDIEHEIESGSKFATCGDYIMSCESTFTSSRFLKKRKKDTSHHSAFWGIPSVWKSHGEAKNKKIKMASVHHNP